MSSNRFKMNYIPRAKTIKNRTSATKSLLIQNENLMNGNNILMKIIVTYVKATEFILRKQSSVYLTI